MEILIEKNYSELCRKVANNIEEFCKNLNKPVFCAASGDTPMGVYECMVNDGKNGYDFHDWQFIGLDEWLGFNGTDEGSCRFHLDQQLFEPLQIPADHICFFDGHAFDAEEECKRVENFITENDGIDLALLGMGMNGHVGMNEPGTSAELNSHLVQLHPTTIAVAQKYFAQKTTLNKGLTIGIGSLLKAKKIILMVSGIHKAAIVAQLLETEPTNELPASLLKSHPDITLWLDSDAVSNLV